MSLIYVDSTENHQGQNSREGDSGEEHLTTNVQLTKILLDVINQMARVWLLQDTIFSRASYFREFRDFKENRENKMQGNKLLTKVNKGINAKTRK